MTNYLSRRIVVATGTLAVVAFHLDSTSGTVEMTADARGTEAVALGHAKFVAPHVTNWTVVEAA